MISFNFFFPAAPSPLPAALSRMSLALSPTHLSLSLWRVCSLLCTVSALAVVLQLFRVLAVHGTPRRGKASSTYHAHAESQVTPSFPHYHDLQLKNPLSPLDMCACSQLLMITAWFVLILLSLVMSREQVLSPSTGPWVKSWNVDASCITQLLLSV